MSRAEDRAARKAIRVAVAAMLDRMCATDVLYQDPERLRTVATAHERRALVDVIRSLRGRSR